MLVVASRAQPLSEGNVLTRGIRTDEPFSPPSEAYDVAGRATQAAWKAHSRSAQRQAAKNREGDDRSFACSQGNREVRSGQVRGLKANDGDASLPLATVMRPVAAPETDVVELYRVS